MMATLLKKSQVGRTKQCIVNIAVSGQDTVETDTTTGYTYNRNEVLIQFQQTLHLIRRLLEHLKILLLLKEEHQRI